MNNRIVALVDMDCFYCQVEAKLNSDLQGKPMAVVQYNAWKGGGIIAVNYEARDRGVSRYMRGNEAKDNCPEIELVRVPSVRGKADLTKYRDASREVFNVICEFSDCVQRASIDEAYIDLTENVNKRLICDEQVTPTHLPTSFVVGYSSQGNNNEDERTAGIYKWLSEVYDDELNGTQLQRLAIGAVIVEEMRAAIFKRTGFRCSAGIAHNKIMAKLICGLHKPNRQTVLPLSGVSELFSNLPVHKVRNLGGKFGVDVMEKLGCKVMADLSRFSERDLQSYFDEKTGTWLYNIARGIDLEPVTPRLISKSIGCCKQFRGRTALHTKKDVLHWIGELAGEISERLDEDTHMNKRKAQSLTVSIQQEINKKKTAMSRSVALPSYDTEAIADVAYSAIKKFNSASQSSDTWSPPLSFLGISVGKFIDDSNSSLSGKTINQYFQNNSTAGPSGSSLNKERETKFKEISENNYLAVKNKGSFFERYFKNNKHLFNEINKNGSSEKDISVKNESPNLSHSSVSVNEESNNILSKEIISTELNINNSANVTKNKVVENVTLVDKSPYFSDSNVNLKEKSVSNEMDSGNCVDNGNDSCHSDEDDFWVSPSEIFPDFNDLDENVVSLLPSPLQRKIIARTKKSSDCQDNNDKNKNFDIVQGHESDKSNNNVKNYINYSNNLVISKSSSNPNPSSSKTVFTTTVHVHNCDNLNEYNSVKSKTEIADVEKQSKFNEDSIDEINEIEIVETNKLNVVNLSENFKSERIITNIGGCSETNLDAIEEIDNSRLSCESLFKVCSYCKESVVVIDFQEHIDHHIALELHQQWNSIYQNESSNHSKNVINKTSVNNESNIKNKSPIKRKRHQPTKKKSTIDSKKHRSILSFFAPK
ncbi:DNA polymerase eta [Lycorma delicatula]|uniref:DNA polymerase eta n=1 Tax=Lycorma delicatula TaxID=130591 RepID=UPI003F517C8A